MDARLMHDWPQPVRDYIKDRFGSGVEVQQLGGMSGAAVVLLQGRGRSAVLKRTSSPVEPYVYSTLADHLRAAGVGLPDLYAAFDAAGTFWLLLEHIPHPFPQERREADPEQVAMLRRLHSIAPDSVALPPGTYQPKWPQSMTESALALFDRAAADRLTELLQPVREATLRLFEPTCLISGDPNPANWGLRDDGSLVLYDWERCTRGAAAIDLAIAVPGLGSRAVFEQVAFTYDGLSALATDIVHAKVWVVIEFLAGYARGEIVPSFPIESLVSTVPAWLSDIGILAE